MKLFKTAAPVCSPLCQTEVYQLCGKADFTILDVIPNRQTCGTVCHATMFVNGVYPGKSVKTRFCVSCKTLEFSLCKSSQAMF